MKKITPNPLTSPLLLTTLFLSACTTAIQPTPEHFSKDHFLAQGRIALRYPVCSPYHGCEQQAINASIDWQHQPKQDQITFYNPLGQQELSLNRHHESIEIQENGDTRQLSQAQLAQELGLPIPFDTLSHLPFEQRPQTTFEQNGWQIRLKNWQGYYYQNIRLQQDDYYINLILHEVK